MKSCTRNDKNGRIFSTPLHKQEGDYNRSKETREKVSLKYLLEPVRVRPCAYLENKNSNIFNNLFLYL
jgi:hypothetical protein